jgi:hypothetical protein
MNARDFKSLYALLLPSLPGFVGHKRMLILPPMNGMLRAIHFDPSGFDKASFYPSRLVMPLCDPTHFLSLLLSKPFYHKTEGYGWTINMPNLVEDLIATIRDEALPALRQAENLDGFLELAAPAWGNPHTPKQVAFVLAKAGQRDRAVAIIDDYLPKLRMHSHWEKEIFDLSTHLRDLLVNDPEAAHRQLLAWEDYTIQKLKLEAFR